MIKFTCEKCQKGFSKKSDYTKHMNRKTSCSNITVASSKKKVVIIEDSDSDVEHESEHESEHDVDIEETSNGDQNAIINQILNIDLSNYKFIDLFCGVGGFHQALARMNAKCVLACDIDKDCRQVYKDNYGLEPVKDVKDIDENNMADFDILCGGFPCFVAGTRVLTHDGYKKIEHVVFDDLLLTHTGNFQEIANLQKKMYLGDLYHINIKYHPETIVCTEEHPFYVREKTRKWNATYNKYDIYFNEPIWKKANELTSNDYYGMVINDKNVIPEFNINGIHFVLDDSNMWFMMGYQIGARNNTKLSWYECFECPEYILSEFGKYNDIKRIPEWVHDAPKEFIQQFLNGYFMGNGRGKRRNIIQINTYSLDVAYGFQRLYLKLGNIFTVHKHIQTKEDLSRNIYSVQGRIDKIPNNMNAFIEDNYAWFKVESDIKKVNVTNEIVYNFEVENDNSYIVENAIVHNCQSFSNGGKKKAFDDDRGLLFDEIMRIAKVKQPKFMFLENVKHILKVSNGEVIKYIKERIAKIGYHLQIFQISPHNYGIPQQRERVYFVCVRNDIYNGKEIVLPKYTGKLEFEKYLDKKEEIDDKYFIKGDILDVLNAWDEMVKKFEVGEKISPTIMINDAYRTYTNAEFDAFPDWKKEYMTKNKPLIKKYEKEFDEWYPKYEDILVKREIYGKLEWQTGEIKKNDSIFNHFIQMRQSGIRVKKSQYFPTLVAISQIPIYGREKRYITPRECARLQSFPESFKMPKEDKKSYKQMGNSVNVDNVFTVISSTMKNYV